MLCLVKELAPQYRREFLVADAESGDKVIFEDLDCPLGGVHVMVVGFEELEADVGFFEVRFDCFRCNIVHDIEF